MITVIIDGRAYQARKGQSMLDVARANDIDIPTLCYHPELSPSGACKLCVVETSQGPDGFPTALLACTLMVSEGLEIQTAGPLVDAARAKAFEDLLRLAPQSNRLRQMAADYGVDLGPLPDGCVRCGLCVRVCKEIIGAGALKMRKANGVSYVVHNPDRCLGCGACAKICPTGAICMRACENIGSILTGTNSLACLGTLPRQKEI